MNRRTATIVVSVLVLVASLLAGGLVQAEPAQAAVSQDGRLSLTITPSTTSLPAGGGYVTYTYVLRNESAAILKPVGDPPVRDASCTDIRYVSGERTSLWAGQSVTYRCTTWVSQTTTSTASASYTYLSWFDRVTTGVVERTTVRVATAPGGGSAPLTPISCTTPTVWVAQGQGADGADHKYTTLYQQYTSNVDTQFISVGDNTYWGYNALAYNPVDRYLYAISNWSAAPVDKVARTGGTFDSGHLLRIDGSGSIQDLGPIGGNATWINDLARGEGDGRVGGITSGSISPTGTMYVNNASSARDANGQFVYSAAVFSIDLTRLASARPYATQVGTRRFPTNDFVYVDGVLYGILNGTSNLITYDPRVNGGSNTQVPGLPQDIFGAAWLFGNGTLGFDGNGSVSPGSATLASVSTSGQLRNQVPGLPSYNNDGASCVGTNDVDLALTKSAPATASVGDTVTFALTVANNGPGVSSGGYVVDEVPAAWTNVAVSPEFAKACTVTGNRVTCQTGVMNPGDRYDITLTAKAPSTAGRYTNTATVTGNELDRVPGNNTGTSTTTVNTAIVDLAKTGTSITGPDAQGRYVASYTVTVRNTGAGAGSYGPITDSPAFTRGVQIEGVRWSGGPTGAAATTVTASGDGSYVFGPAGTPINPGATHTYQVAITLRTAPDLADGQLTACGASPTPGAGLYNAASTPGESSTARGNNEACLPPMPVIALDKTADTTSLPGPGGQVTYTYVVDGWGAEPIRDVRLVDDRCPVAQTHTGDTNGDGLLDPTETWTYTCTSTLQQDTTNVATVTGRGAVSGLPVTATDRWTVTVPQPAINVAKQPGPVTGPDADGTYRAAYTVTVTNSGQGVGSYSALVDTPAFDPDRTTVTGATWTGPGGMTGSGGPASSYRLVDGARTLAAGATETFQVTISFTHRARSGELSTCAGPGTGLFNAVTATGETGPSTDNSACDKAPAFPTRPLHVAKVGPGGTPLEGASFAVYDVDPATAGARPITDGITPDAPGGAAFTTTPLDLDRPYWLVETKAPSGYALLPTPVRFALTATGVRLDGPAPGATVTGADRLTLQVSDSPTATLPRTGGPGAPAVPAAGVLIVLAAVLAAARTRRRQEATT